MALASIDVFLEKESRVCGEAGGWFVTEEVGRRSDACRLLCSLCRDDVCIWLGMCWTLTVEMFRSWILLRIKFGQESSQSFWIQKNKETHGKLWHSFYSRAVNTDCRSCSQEGILNANPASKTISYSKQNPLELLWVSTSLNTSCGDKRVCHCQFVHLCLVTKQPPTPALYQIGKVQHIEYDVPRTTNTNTVSQRADGAAAASEQTSRSTAAVIVDSKVDSKWISGSRGKPERRYCHRGSMTTIWKIVRFGPED